MYKLSNMTILITRPQPEASELAAQLEHMGYQTLIDSMLNINPLSFPAIDLRAAQAFVFTSANSIRSLPLTLLSSIDKTLPAYAVGEATACVAHEFGFRNLHTSNAGALELCRQLQKIQAPTKGPIIFFSGKHTAIDLPHILASSNFNTQKHIVYEAKAAKHFTQNTVSALQNKEIQQVLFFSPRTAQIFVKLLQEEALTRMCKTMIAICFSKNIADIIQGTIWKNLLVADAPHMDSLLPLIKQSEDL